MKISVIREMVSNSLTDNSFTVMYGTKYLLKSMMKNYEVYEKKVLYEFMRECIEKPL